MIALQPGDVPTLHAFVDGSVIELILGERIGYTKRFYYTRAVLRRILLSSPMEGYGMKMECVEDCADLTR